MKFLHIALLFAAVVLIASAASAQADTPAGTAEWAKLTRSGLTAFRLGKLTTAERLLSKALVESHRFKRTDGRRAVSMQNLAAVFSAQNRKEEATALLEGSLAEAQIAIEGPEQLDLSAVLNSLAAMYCELGDFRKAEPLYLKSLALLKKSDLKTRSVTLDDLAVVYTAQGKYKQAESSELLALKLKRGLFKADDIAMATSLNNLAGIYFGQGRYKESMTTLLETMRILEASAFQTSPHMASAMSTIAELYRLQGDFKQAAALNSEARALRERHFGKDHVQIALSLINAGSLSLDRGNLVAAEKDLIRAADILTKNSPNHPKMVVTLNLLGTAYQRQNKLSLALSTFEKSYLKAKQTLGKDHPDTAVSLNHLAEVHRAQKKFKLARSESIQALAIQERALGANHLAIADTLENLYLIDLPTKGAGADALAARCLALREKYLGSAHPTLLRTRQYLSKPSPSGKANA
jgi:tetratricopeptide (TPR) repeat protein